MRSILEIVETQDMILIITSAKQESNGNPINLKNENSCKNSHTFIHKINLQFAVNVTQYKRCSINRPYSSELLPLVCFPTQAIFGTQ